GGRAAQVRARERDECRQVCARLRVDAAAQALRAGQQALGLRCGAVGALHELLDQACALLGVHADVLTGIQLRLEVTPPGRDVVAPCDDAEPVLADAVNGELTLP